VLGKIQGTTQYRFGRLRDITVPFSTDQFDLCGVLVAGVIFYLIGRKLIQGKERLGNWGWALSGISFLGMFLVGLFLNGSADQLVGVALGSAGAASIVLGGSWILLGLASLIHEYTVAPPLRAVRGWFRGRRALADQRRRNEEAEIQRRYAQAEYERSAPERERQRHQAEMQALADADGQRRREDARAASELLYALHAAEISVRYPRSEFDAYLQKYMSDAHEPGYVEERAGQLKEIIERQLEKVEPASKRMSLQALANWYEKMRTEVDASPLPSRQKNVQLAQLSNRYQELVQEVLEEMTP
jgi:hypothetical protein